MIATRPKTWRVLRWENPPEATGEAIPMECECGCDAELPSGLLVGGSLIAITADNYFIFDPPGFEPPANWLPTEVQCRICGRKLAGKLTVEEEA